MYDVNIRAQFFLTQQIVRDMLPRGGGAVCNITSVHALAGRSGAFGVRRHQRSDCCLYPRSGRGVGSPGRPRQRHCAGLGHGGELLQGDSRIPGGGGRDEAAHNAVPVGRAGTPLDIARLAAFLCSDDAEFIVGQTLVADGGTTSLMSLFPNFREQSKNRFGTGYVPGV